MMMRYSPQLPSLHSAIATDVSAGIRASERIQNLCVVRGGVNDGSLIGT